MKAHLLFMASLLGLSVLSCQPILRRMWHSESRLGPIPSIPALCALPEAERERATVGRFETEEAVEHERIKREVLALKGDLSILPAVRRDLWSSDVEARRSALTALKALGPAARSEIPHLIEYDRVFPLEAHHFSTLFAVDESRGLALVRQLLDGPRRGLLLADYLPLLQDEHAAWWPLLEDELRTVAAADPRLRMRGLAQTILAAMSIEVPIAPDDCAVVAVEGRWMDTGKPWTEWGIVRVTLSERTVDMVPRYEFLRFANARSTECLEAAREGTWYHGDASFDVTEDGCLVAEDNGEWGGFLHYRTNGGFTCTVANPVHPLGYFDWQGKRWLMTEVAIAELAATTHGTYALQDTAVVGTGTISSLARESDGSLLVLIRNDFPATRTRCSQKGREDFYYSLLRLRPDLTLESVVPLPAPERTD